MRLFTIPLVATLGLTCVLYGAVRPTKEIRLAGTYSNLEFHEASGDLVGMELKIVPAVDDHQAAILVSEGAPAQMVVVDVRQKDRDIAFDVPATTTYADDSWSFRGMLSARQLTGTITYASGARARIVLPRRCGYWDR